MMMGFLFYLLLATSTCWLEPHMISGYYVDLKNIKIIDTSKINITMDDLKLTKNPERFDQERYQRIQNAPYAIEESADGTVVEMYSAAAGKSYAATPLNSYYQLVKTYYPNGITKAKGWAYVNFFAAGIWYEFDEGGELVKEVDYDALFKFTFKDILAFCKNNNIEVAKGYIPQSTGYHTHIYRDITDGKSWWSIEHRIKTESAYFIETIKMDGNTGKVISKTSYEDLPE